MIENSTKGKPSFWFIQLGSWAVYGLAVVVTSVPLRHERDYIAFRTAYVSSRFCGSNGFAASFLFSVTARVIKSEQPDRCRALNGA
jgi:hypothetical protein